MSYLVAHFAAELDMQSAWSASPGDGCRMLHRNAGYPPISSRCVTAHMTQHR